MKIGSRCMTKIVAILLFGLCGTVNTAFSQTLDKVRLGYKRSRGEAREKSTSAAYLPVRRSEAIERNETYGTFSAAC